MGRGGGLAADFDLAAGQGGDVGLGGGDGLAAGDVGLSGWRKSGWREAFGLTAAGWELPASSMSIPWLSAAFGDVGGSLRSLPEKLS